MNINKHKIKKGKCFETLFGGYESQQSELETEHAENGNAVSTIGYVVTAFTNASRVTVR